VTRCGPNPLREGMQDPLGVFAPHGRTLRAGAATVPPAGATFAVKHIFDVRWFARDPALFVAGGGDTLSTLAHAGALEKLSYVSTAGGAFLDSEPRSARDSFDNNGLTR
jgi:hypothetical protein